MKTKIILFLIVATTSVAGLCFAGDNTTGNAPNPPASGMGGPNTMVNSDKNTSANSY